MAVTELILAGRMDEEDYQKCYECVEYLKEERSREYRFQVLQMVPVHWEAHLQTIRDQLGADQVSVSTTCIVYSPDFTKSWVGDHFVDHISRITNFKVFPYPPGTRDPEAYYNQAKIRYNQFLKSTGHVFCWFKMSINGETVPERVVMELYTDVCPRTAENFRHLCVGDMPTIRDAVTGKDVVLSYKGTRIFRIVKEGWVQGGDIIRDKGNGGYSIYGETFPDESFAIQHDGEGVVGMANEGPNTNGSQFYITVARASWMDKRYVAFARVIEGINVWRKIHALATRPNQMPQVPVVVEDSGEVDLDQF